MTRKQRNRGVQRKTGRNRLGTKAVAVVCAVCVNAAGVGIQTGALGLPGDAKGQPPQGTIAAPVVEQPPKRENANSAPRPLEPAAASARPAVLVRPLTPQAKKALGIRPSASLAPAG